MLSGNIAVAQQLAEETTLENEFLNFIPTSYTKDGQIIFYSANTKDKESGLFKNLQVYNEGFEEIKDISIENPTYETYTLIKRREPVRDFTTGNVTYTGDWVSTKENEYETNGYNLMGLESCTETDGGMACSSKEYGYLTQTLFNEDEKFEYFFTTQEIRETNKVETDRDNDGQIDEIWTSFSLTESGLEIRQDDGTVIFRHEYSNEAGSSVEGWPKIYKVGGKAFLMICEQIFHPSEPSYNKYTIYSVSKEASEIAYVKTLAGALRAYPNPARKGGILTMEFPKAQDADARREVRVTSMDGQTLLCHPVAADAHTVQIPLRRMNAGIYNFTLTENGQVVENSRIVVR